MYQHLLAPIQQFLQCETPDAWIEEAKKPQNLSIILQDHMLCELKAAQSAMFLLRKYAADSESNQNLLLWMKPYEDFAYRKIGDLNSLKGKSQITKKIEPRSDQPYAAEIIDKMVLLIKEELHHFYQVLEIIEQRGIELENISAGRYAKGLMREVINHEPHTLVDKLIIGAFIEARSCERFAKLAPYLDAQLEKFYVSLLRSEARHYEDYLILAQQIAAQDISARVAHFARVEAELISTPDDEFKFHSGVPSA
ncbi:tRNA isopentenyl-2-thiomethyl-A-37 hydroxylase MiaE [Testudinibacter sp. TR-2022]|uniref:tRNA isopentenyl-2-thiomethyl-A-37 hydroxylase MiaE n=1 Tax=Testudinibacter sp. TR-2022 TaxID=2585029 RepID=UPI00111A49F0|nr:tRNA isopentenyl-2-thiomethyl-A-37 hydroxylase MiaE [Testudinibacter sp. TR-2022]TNH09226.1 tRNA-(ms[2]io[6]A)-hydroxylase [Pasteurellaceae bacterium Phil11]TNH23285.1 tRNA-(ms[2]io[6]A)-hydroxylase [Testudinibacter sp. TR-2022]TNH25841.1 tRNA-(ms[2]io[6]A)-hydroxylase [Testudinibacter sp. TR-2022]